MRGTRPLTKHEINRTLSAFKGRLQLRDKSLFLLGCTGGFRIQELLSLRVKDIIQDNQIVERVTVEKRNTKGSIESRSVKLQRVTRNALLEWIQNGLWQRGYVSPSTFLFKSENGLNKAISTRHAYRVLTKNYKRLGFAGKLGTHSMRKTYAKFMHRDLVRRRAQGDPVDPLPLVSISLGHKSLNSTMSYLSFMTEDIDKSSTNFMQEVFGES